MSRVNDNLWGKAQHQWLYFYSIDTNFMFIEIATL